MKTFKTYITESAAKVSCLVLVQQLQDAAELFKQLHWNVEGEGFLEIHKLFGEIYSGIQEYQDRVAEKARGTGVYITLSNSPIVGQIETEESIQFAFAHLTKLRDGLEMLRAPDLAIENMLGELAEQIDSWLYKLKSSMEIE